MKYKLRPWNISDLDSLVKYANNWNVAKNLTVLLVDRKEEYEPVTLI